VLTAEWPPARRFVKGVAIREWITRSICSVKPETADTQSAFLSVTDIQLSVVSVAGACCPVLP
jgi:hypothetical protein